MKSRFDWAFTFMMHHEGGWANYENDPGGPTKYGISLRYLRSQGELGDLDGDGDVDIDDVRALTKDTAREFYRESFWASTRCNEIMSQLIATKFFDICVNTGPRQAGLILQEALVDYGKDVTVDGIVGGKTLKAVNDLEDRDYLLINNIREIQKEFYTNLVSEKPSLNQFIRGWLRRAAS